MNLYGAAMGREQWLKGTNVMLGPGVNLARVPWCGRNFEYQGEDPLLASRMIAAEIEGIQSNNISACVKHYVFNSQEFDRSGQSANVPDRAAKELYYKPFHSAVDAGVGSAMCSYNRANGTWACENANTLNELKTVAGFEGWVMSDWGATHSTEAAANNGLDQQMPDDGFFGAPLRAAVAAGSVPQSRIDDMVLRMLTPMFALGLMADPPTPDRNLSAPALTAAHNALSRALAMRSITLLKNEGNLLPVNPAALASVVVLGDASTVHGDGSGGVVTPYVITPAQGLFALINTGSWAVPTSGPPGVCAVEDNTDYFQDNSPSVFAASAADCCTACSNTPGCNSWTWDKGTTCWLKPNADGRRANSAVMSGNVTTHPTPPPTPKGAVNVTYYAGQDAAGAAAACAGASLCVMVVATKSSEGGDRGDLSLPTWQDAMAAAVVAANPNTVVVARCPGACFMPWRDAARAILFELMPGQESGNSVAATILGANNPSGRLPVSFPATMVDTWLGNPVNPLQYPGTDRGRGFPESDYTEGLFMGYKWYDAQNISPLWPFGFGLSYSTFTYSQLAVFVSSAPNPPKNRNQRAQNRTF
jgi:beta-glucosidase